MEWAHLPPSSSFPSFMQLDRLAMEERALGSSESISPGPAFMSVEGKHAGTTCGQKTGTDPEDCSWTSDSMGTLFINNNLFLKNGFLCIKKTNFQTLISTAAHSAPVVYSSSLVCHVTLLFCWHLKQLGNCCQWPQEGAVMLWSAIESWQVSWWEWWAGEWLDLTPFNMPKTHKRRICCRAAVLQY